MKKRIIPILLVICIFMQICFGIIAISAGPFAGGSGTLRDPYIITNQSQLNDVQNYLTSNFALGNDIYMSNYFTPIGSNSSSKAFTGTFDGRDYTIFNLRISGTGHMGLFGYTNNASITNLNLVGGTIYGSSYVGSIVGYANNTIIIDNCTSSVNVNATASNSGGLVGYANDDCRISNSSYSGSISGKIQTGGIVGYAKRNSFSEASPAITRCSVTGSVSGSSDVGGIAGQIYGYITQCYTTGSVIASSSNVGGIVGYLYSSANTNAHVLDSYSTGYIEGNSYVGGIAGKLYETLNSGSTSVRRSYSTSNIYANSNYAGGLVGALSSSYGSIERSVAINQVVDKYNTTKTTVGAFAGNNMRGSYNLYRSDISLWARYNTVTPSGGSPRTLDQLKQAATYQSIGWDIGNPGSIWAMDASKSAYPVLRVQSPDVRLANSKIVVYLCESVKLDAYPNTASNIWSSSNPDVVSVNAVGSLYGESLGTAEITVTAANGTTDTCSVEVTYRPTPTFSFVITMLQGETVSLASMQGADHIKATWESMDPTIATVDPTGMITALSPGTTRINAYDMYGQDFPINVEVLEAIPVNGITVEESSFNLDIGQSVGVEYTITPENATDQRVVWDSSNKSVATVEDGIITTLSPGVAIITVTTLNGSYTATIYVAVEHDMEGIAVTPENPTVIMGNELQFKADTIPERIKVPNVTWSSSDESVATIEDDGTIVTVAPGTTVITATTEDGVSGETVLTVRDLITETIAAWITIPQSGPYRPSESYNNLPALLSGEGVKIEDGFSSGTLKAAGWQFTSTNTRAWQVEFMTIGLKNITVNSIQTANNPSPNNFVLEYSLDGYTWKSVSVSNDPDNPIYEYYIRSGPPISTEKKLEDIPLPEDCENRTKVLVRWRCINDLNPLGEAVTAGAGSFIKNIVIKGQH